MSYIKNCIICNRVDHNKFNKNYGETLCRQHYNQYEKYGEFFKWNISRENEYITKGDVTEIILRNRSMDEVGRCIINTDDLHLVIGHKWNMSRGYCRSNSVGFLHKFIMGEVDGMCVDHIDRNRLNCRKSNLRHVDFHKNGWNKGKQSNNTSGHVGVSWEKRRTKWEAHIKLNGKKKFLGYFSDINDAIKARKLAEAQYFGEEVNRDNDKHTVFKKKLGDSND